MISDKIETRQLITLGADGVLVRGTYHDVPLKEQGGSNAQGKIGVVFLNPLSTPRALIGDSAVCWANSFAAQGYPSLRFDLPGLGDSYGETAKDLVTFINEAGFAAITASKIREFTKAFGLSGVVIYGHCAGGVTAVYAASECQECKGLIITDPYFNAANLLTPKLSPGMVDWARRSKVGEVLRAIYARIREARNKQDNGTLPGNANVRLVTHWKRVVSSGLPILVFKSGEPAALGSGKLRAASFDYLEHITSFAGHRSRLSIKTIEGTNHSFCRPRGASGHPGTHPGVAERELSRANRADTGLSKPRVFDACHRCKNCHRCFRPSSPESDRKQEGWQQWHRCCTRNAVNASLTAGPCVSHGDECNMLLYEAVGKAPRAAQPWMRQRRASGVTFLKTLVSDYQILSPVSTFACTLGQQSSQYKPMTLLGRFLCTFRLV